MWLTSEKGKKEDGFDKARMKRVAIYLLFPQNLLLESATGKKCERLCSNSTSLSSLSLSITLLLSITLYFLSSSPSRRFFSLFSIAPSFSFHFLKAAFVVFTFIT